ncbi:hypothetical protein E1B28_013049 [Marasmius oreades]|uniref:Uncharacterized protein n=1 Tax=Marasmius oreades TaxID=181124 RepID=A0A9P7RPU5_9AGAR|nr:uncharacterized protein E1B28_013049 [Marasmius oreades]KAG7087066.1 hypothetical protein E1B28_013049 [Marasmius oreades]
MRSYAVVFTSRLALLTVTLSFAKAFTINGLPAVVTAGQVETLTWTRDKDDPTNFQLAKSSAGKLGMIGSPLTVDKQEETQGTLPVTFIDAPTQVTIVAYDLKHGVSVDPNKDKPFFTDTAHPINIQFPPSPHMSPAQVPHPTSTTSAPTITPNTPPGSPNSASQTQVPTVPTSVSVNSTSMANGGTITTKGLPGASTGQSGSSGSSQSGMFGNLGYNSTVASATNTIGPVFPGDPTNPSTSPPPHPSNLGIIVGTVLGSLAFIVFIILLVVCILRRYRKRITQPDRPGIFYRDKMIKSDERIPRVHSDLEPLNHTSNDSPTVDDAENTNLITSRNRSSDATTLSVPDYRTIYTITETDSAYVSYEGSDLTSIITEHAEPYNGVAPRTERQMSIEKKIFQLQGKLIRLHGESRSTGSIPSIPSIVGDIRERIERLKILQEGEWAREISDDVPIEMYGS